MRYIISFNVLGLSVNFVEIALKRNVGFINNWLPQNNFLFFIFYIRFQQTLFIRNFIELNIEYILYYSVIGLISNFEKIAFKTSNWYYELLIPWKRLSSFQ